MSTLAVVILSALGGIVVLAFLAGIAVLIWIAWSLKKILTISQNENRELAIEIRALLAQNEAETKRMLDSAKASFQSLKQETKTILDLHAETMKGVISRINADAIVQNVAKFTAVCARLENGINAFQKLILDNLETDRGQTEYEPEQQAPERTQFGTPASQYSVSTSAQYDVEAEREASAEVFQESESLG